MEKRCFIFTLTGGASDRGGPDRCLLSRLIQWGYIGTLPPHIGAGALFRLRSQSGGRGLCCEQGKCFGEGKGKWYTFLLLKDVQWWWFLWGVIGTGCCYCFAAVDDKRNINFITKKFMENETYILFSDHSRISKHTCWLTFTSCPLYLIFTIYICFTQQMPLNYDLFETEQLKLFECV